MNIDDEGSRIASSGLPTRAGMNLICQKAGLGAGGERNEERGCRLSMTTHYQTQAKVRSSGAGKPVSRRADKYYICMVARVNVVNHR
jgi:hypothetical protein